MPKYTIDEVAHAMGCSPFTVRSWISRGLMKNVGSLGGAGRKALIRLDDLKKVAPYRSRRHGELTFEAIAKRLEAVAVSV